MVSILRSLWNYKGFIFGMVNRDFRSKYLNSTLGLVWAIVNPLALILVYTLIFTQIMQAKLPEIQGQWAYSIYLCAGVLPWNYFVETIQRMQNLFFEQSNILKKLNFPKITLPVYILISCTINFSISMVIFAIFLFSTNHIPDYHVISFFPLLILQQLIAIGIGMFVATLNVFVRDIGQIMGIILQFWFWMTAIVYPLNVLPENLQKVFSYNFMLPIIEGYHKVFVFHDWPLWEPLIYPLVVATIFISLGFFTYKKLNKEMVDEL